MRNISQRGQQWPTVSNNEKSQISSLQLQNNPTVYTEQRTNIRCAEPQIQNETSGKRLVVFKNSDVVIEGNRSILSFLASYKGMTSSSPYRYRLLSLPLLIIPTVNCRATNSPRTWKQQLLHPVRCLFNIRDHLTTIIRRPSKLSLLEQVSARMNETTQMNA